VSDGFNQTAQERPSEESSFPVPAFQLTPDSPLKISFLVGDEVTSLKFIRFLKDKLETPYVVSYGRLTDGAAEDVEHFFAGVRVQRLFVPGIGRYFYQTAARVSGDEKISRLRRAIWSQHIARCWSEPLPPH
jgi:hypothetical protein